MSPVGLSPASPTTRASSTLWAQPSKEWVVPAKPRPGRKPKKGDNTGAAVPQGDLDGDCYGSRRMQNRVAQRAFRERKQTQLAELQARLHSYEQGGIERNVALQNIAKKMKEDNEELRKENQILRERIAQLEHERDEFLEKDKKRAYDDVSPPSSSFPLTGNSATKRARVDEDVQEALSPSPLPPFPLSSSSFPDDATRTSDFISGHESRPPRSALSNPPLANNTFAFTMMNETASTLDNQDIIESFNCILCSPDAPCVCRGVTVQTATNTNSPLRQLPLQSEDLRQQSVTSFDQSAHLNTPSNLKSPSIASVSILDNLPAFQAPVPIRRRTGTSRANPVFPVTPLVTASSTTPRCSGDPDNCKACADDNFGKAFCHAIGHSLNATLPCVDCPKRASQTDDILVGGCCDGIGRCGSCGIAPIVSSINPSHGDETMPTDDAWRQLKCHPNVAFADLALLAEVVARRSKCNGSRVVISPAPGTATPELGDSILKREDRPALPTDPHEQCPLKQRQRELAPQLVPQHVLIECGRRKMREVNADGVREALRLLDQKFAHTR